MMAKAPITFLTALFLATAATAGLPVPVNAVGLVVTPPSVSADYSGTIALNITGVSLGQTVVVEEFFDPEHDGVVGPNDKLLLHFTVTDGQLSLIGGQRNINVPGDEDLSQDGNIQTILNFKALPETNRFGAHFIFRVSPASGGSTLASTVFPVDQPLLPQGVTGQVSSGGSPVPGAYVFLLPPSGPGIVVATIANGGGNFTLNTAPGTYQLLALKKDQLFDFSTAPTVTINAGVVTVRNLSMVPATGPTISGQLTDAVSHAGIVAVQVFASTKSGQGQDNTGLATIVHTDDSGSFNIPVSTASTEWRLEFSNKDAALLGYNAPSRVKVDISGGSVNVPVQWTKANALIFGSFKDNQHNPLPGIEIDANDSNNLFQNLGYTDDLGEYAVGITGGSWNVGPSGDDPALAGYVVSGQNVNVSNGEAVQVNFVAQAACAHLRGHVTDETSAAVGNVSVLACLQNQGGQCPSATTIPDGSFDIAVPGGTWSLFLESNSAAQQGLLSSQLQVTVTCPQDQNGLTLPVLHSTGHITGSVRDTSTAPISNVFVYAFATIGARQYNTRGQTDNDGTYSLPVANGDWQVGVECNALQSLGFNCPLQQFALVNGTNPVVNFVVQPVSACLGDCNDNQHVTVDEILLMVNIALGNGTVMDCEAGDANHNGQITVDEILAAVNKALNGC